MTLPRFDINDFPIETDQPRIEVTLPVGRHVLELVVEDSAGLRSAPATVVVTVEQSPPEISQIQPNSGTQSSTVRANIRGENLLGISQVSFSGTGVTASILPGGTNNNVPVEITITPQATIGGRSVTVTTPGGTATSSGGVQFTVQQNAPVVRSISPTSGTQGTESLRVTISGENLSGAREVTFSGTGVGVNRIISSTATGVVADISIAPGARAGARTFTVTTPGGRGSSPEGVDFAVQQAAPTITGIDPTSGNPGSRVTATLRGANLSGATQVAFSGSGVTVDRVSGSSDTSVSVNLTIADNAAAGPRSFTVTTPGGTARSPDNVSFEVQQAGPVITGISPASGEENTRSMRVVISGQNLAGARQVEFSGSGVTVNQIVSNNDASLVADIAIADNAPVGARTFTVTTLGGTATSPRIVVFTVQQAAPTISSITPDRGISGQSLEAMITGANLSGARTVSFSGTGVIARISGTPTDRQVPIAINIDSNAAAGARTFTVQTTRGNVDSGSSRITFSVVTINLPTIGPFPTFRPVLTPTEPTISPTLSPFITRATISPTSAPIITRATISPDLSTFSRVTATTANTQPVDAVSGIGPTFRSRLEGGGIRTVNDLANAQPAEVARLLGTTEVRAMGFIDSARSMG